MDEGRSKNWQMPKKDHPWRHWVDKEGDAPVKKKNIKSLKLFVQEIAESWDEVTVVTTSSTGYGEYTLKELTQEKQAAWLAGILKRNYGQQY
jgi:hypothetical protein